jgi:hypothetical protein
MGFEQHQNVRAYQFDRVAKGERAVRFVITVDISMFLKHRIAIQEGPGLCARKLLLNLESQHEGLHELTSDDLAGYLSARAAEEARKASSRKSEPKPQPEI